MKRRASSCQLHAYLGPARLRLKFSPWPPPREPPLMLGDAQGDALLVLSPPSLDSTTSDVVDKDRSTSTTRVALQKWNGTMVQAVKARRKQPLWLNLGSATMRRVNQTPAPPPEASVRRKGGEGEGEGESLTAVSRSCDFSLYLGCISWCLTRQRRPKQDAGLVSLLVIGYTSSSSSRSPYAPLDSARPVA